MLGKFWSICGGVVKMCFDITSLSTRLVMVFVEGVFRKDVGGCCGWYVKGISTPFREVVGGCPDIEGEQLIQIDHI